MNYQNGPMNVVGVINKQFGEHCKGKNAENCYFEAFLWQKPVGRIRRTVPLASGGCPSAPADVELIQDIPGTCGVGLEEPHGGTSPARFADTAIGRFEGGQELIIGKFVDADQPDPAGFELIEYVR